MYSRCFKHGVDSQFLPWYLKLFEMRLELGARNDYDMLECVYQPKPTHTLVLVVYAMNIYIYIYIYTYMLLYIGVKRYD